MTVQSAARLTLQGLRAELARPLQLVDLFRLGQQIRSCAEGSAECFTESVRQRIAVIGGMTTDYLVRAVACAVMQEGVLPVIYQAPYGAFVQEVLDPNSGLHRFRPELVLIAADRRDIREQVPIGAATSEIAEAIAAGCRTYQQLWDILQERHGAIVMQHVLVPSPHRACGMAERLAPAAPANFVGALNQALIEAGRGRVHWVELDRLAAEVGLRSFAAERFHSAAKLPFDPQFLPDYLPFFRGAWRAANGRAKKALVLDLDNTLWGGVIGDDGIEGIKLGPGSAAGEAFAAWGAYLRELRARGIVLAVCSKNAPEIAATGFEHPHTVLRRADFAAFECSWNDKASGLRRVAQALNLGLDALVFADDNAAECEMVRANLPEVAVIELGDDPANFAERIERGHWFDIPAYTAEDFQRSAAYGARARALAAEQEAPDIASYLAGLEMVGSVGRPAEADMPRLAQLEQKTNQFNLTTRRYSEVALREFVRRPDAIVLSFRLADRFADHGLVSTLIGIQEGEELRIDSWLMSCRVFSRGAEAFILRRLIALAEARGVRRLVGEFRPSQRNGVVADLYARLGFHAADAAGERWLRELDGGVGDLESFIADAGEMARAAAA